MTRKSLKFILVIFLLTPSEPVVYGRFCSRDSIPRSNTKTEVRLIRLVIKFSEDLGLRKEKEIKK